MSSLFSNEIIGNRNALVAWQDRFHEHMSVRIYKQAVRLTEEMEQIRTTIESIGTFNAQKKKEEALRKLNEWMPQYNKFQEQLKPFEQQIEDYLEANSSMRAQIDRQTWDVHGHKLRADDLERQLWEYKEFIDSIPEDLRDELQLRFEQMQEQELDYEQEQSFFE